MDSSEEDLDSDEDRIEDTLLALECAPCICRRLEAKNEISSWEHSSGKKAGHRKRGEAASRTQPLLRKGERSVLSLNDGFVFRHYEDTRRYIEQYREIHSSTCAETEVEVKPVMGIDLPDPYLPKIGTTGNGLLERLRIIEAMSDYYRAAAATRSDVNSICLTGRRAETASRTTRTGPVTKPKTDHLPVIKTSSNNGHSVLYSSITENNVSNSLTDDSASKRKGRPSDNLESLSFPFVTEVELPSQATKRCEPTKRNPRANVNASPSSFQWKENGFQNEKPKSISFGKSPKKGKLIRDDSSNGETCVESKLAAIGRAKDVPRKNLRHDVNQVRTPRQKHVSVGKCEVFSSSPRQSKSRRTRTKFPSETAFIRILGQATGPPPPKAVSTKVDVMKGPGSGGRPGTQNGKVPMQLLGRFGGHFQHVLEARSFKPADKNVVATAVANVRADYY